MFVGGGAGIATFLSFVDREFIKATKATNPNDDSEWETQSVNKFMDFVFIFRELEHMRWMPKYLNAVLTIPSMTKKMRFHLYISSDPKCSKVSSYLFWKAMILYNKKQNELGNTWKLNIQLGRPELESLIESTCVKNIYSCGPKVMTRQLEGIVQSVNSWKNREGGKVQKAKVVLNYEIF